MTRLVSMPPKRKPYVPRTILCQSCLGKGEHKTRCYPSPRAGFLVTKCGACNGTGRVVPSPVTHAPDCTGCGGIYQCEGCRKFCGWCVGASDDMPDHCDECWAKAHPAPKRLRSNTAKDPR